MLRFSRVNLRANYSGVGQLGSELKVCSVKYLKTDERFTCCEAEREEEEPDVKGGTEDAAHTSAHTSGHAQFQPPRGLHSGRQTISTHTFLQKSK